MDGRAREICGSAIKSRHAKVTGDMTVKIKNLKTEKVEQNLSRKREREVVVHLQV